MPNFRGLCLYTTPTLLHQDIRHANRDPQTLSFSDAEDADLSVTEESDASFQDNEDVVPRPGETKEEQIARKMYVYRCISED